MNTLFSIIYSTPNVPKSFKMKVYRYFTQIPRIYKILLEMYIYQYPEIFQNWIQKAYYGDLDFYNLEALIQELKDNKV